jgi:outer membrane protein assembly factor BamB
MFIWFRRCAGTLAAIINAAATQQEFFERVEKMSRMAVRGCLFLAAFVIFGLGANICAGQERLVSPAVLSEANLKVLWETRLPMNEGEALDRMFLVDGRVYALSTKNYLTCLSGKNGNMLFAREIAEPNMPIHGFYSYKGKNVFSVIGGNLVEINPEHGTEVRSTRLALGITCPPARNSSFFFIAASDNRLHVYAESNRVHAFEVAAEDGSAITSIIADDEAAFFSTLGGDVIKMAPDRPTRMWRFDASDPVVGPLVTDDKFLYFAAKSPNLYKVNAITGKLEWKYQTTAILDTAPRVTEQMVYQYAVGTAFLAIDKENGKMLWQIEDGLDLLAQSQETAYVFTAGGQIVAMDNKKVKKLHAVNVPGVSKYITNTADEKIFLADYAGRVACLVPAE